MSILHEHRQVAAGCDQARESSSVVAQQRLSLAVIEEIYLSSSRIRAAAVARQAPSPITGSEAVPSSSIEGLPRSMAIIMERTRRAVALLRLRRVLVADG